MGFGHFIKMITKAIPFVDTAAQFIAKKVAPSLEKFGQTYFDPKSKWGQRIQKASQIMEKVGNDVHKWYTNSPEKLIQGSKQHGD